jgi:hypothetical protein
VVETYFILILKAQRPLMIGKKDCRFPNLIEVYI